MTPSQTTIAAIRYGYGFAPGQTPPQDADTLLAQLDTAGGALPLYITEGIDARRQDGAERQLRREAVDKEVREGRADDSLRKAVSGEINGRLKADIVARVAQAVRSPAGFHERLAAFWFDHFSVSTAKSEASKFLTPVFEAEAIRPKLAGRFADLAEAAVRHPAMVVYLDQDNSAGPDSEAVRKGNGRRGLNENLGRELIELHTMGARSGYGQADVRGAALVLAGLTVDRKGGFQTVFRPALAQPSETTVLGDRYGSPKPSEQAVLDMIDDLSAKPQTAWHICRKLVTHFIADDPPDEVVRPMIDAWTASGGNLTEVYRAMLAQPRAWQVAGAKIKRPFDFIVSGLRAVGADEALITAAANREDSPEDANVRKMRDLTINAMRRMGHSIWQPPSPAGFDEYGAAWLNPSQLAERINWARRVAAQFTPQAPNAFARLALGDAAREDTLKTISRAPDRAQAAMMVLASAEFNRR